MACRSSTVYNPVKHKLAKLCFAWLKYGILLSVYASPFVPCSVIFGVCIVDLIFPLKLVDSVQQQQSMSRYWLPGNSMKILSSLFPYSVFPTLAQDKYPETHTSTGRIVLPLKFVILHCSTKKKNRDFKLGTKHLMRKILAAVHSA